MCEIQAVHPTLKLTDRQREEYTTDDWFAWRAQGHSPAAIASGKARIKWTPRFYTKDGTNWSNM